MFDLNRKPPKQREEINDLLTDSSRRFVPLYHTDNGFCEDVRTVRALLKPNVIEKMFFSSIVFAQSENALTYYFLHTLCVKKLLTVLTSSQSWNFPSEKCEGIVRGREEFVQLSCWPSARATRPQAPALPDRTETARPASRVVISGQRQLRDTQAPAKAALADSMKGARP